MPKKDLDLIELISHNGPCTLDELTSLAAFTRSSVYRSLISLESQGWLRRSIDGRRYFLSSKIEKVLDRASFPPMQAERILDCVRKNTWNSKYRLALIHHVRGAAFEIVDSSDRQAEVLSMMLDVQDILSRIARLTSHDRRQKDTDGTADLRLIELQTLLTGRVSDDPFIVDDFSKTSVIAFDSDEEGLFVLLCAAKDAMSAKHERIAHYCRTICRVFNEQEKGRIPNTHETVVLRGRKRRVIQLSS